MARFRKTIEVDAVQWTGENRDEVTAFVGSLRSRLTFTSHEPPLAVIRMSDWQAMEIPVGDWLVEEPIGETVHLRHVWASQFAASYKPIASQQSREASR